MTTISGRSRARTSRARAKSQPKRRSGSLIGGLFYWALTLGVWGVIGGGALMVYYGSQLPPIDQLSVPKRPPNIAIMGADGALLANRGDTGGAAIRIAELPPYLPKAFVAIEDRRFYSHWGVDPLGIGRALLRNVIGTRRHAGRLDAHPAARQESVPDAGAHDLAQDPGGDPRPLARAQISPRTRSSNSISIASISAPAPMASRRRPQRYFGHSAKTATLSEAAVLAGLMKAPSKLAPDRNPEGRDRARRAGHHRHGAGRLHLRQGRQGRARRAGPRAKGNRRAARSITPPIT